MAHKGNSHPVEQYPTQALTSLAWELLWVPHRLGTVSPPKQLAHETWHQNKGKISRKGRNKM